MKTLIYSIIAYTFFTAYSLCAQDNVTLACFKDAATEEIVPSRVLGEDRRIWVQVPSDAKPYERFPVVYVLDGGEQMAALATVHHYYWGNYLPRMILVGISNQENRNRDLTPTKVKGMKSGGAEKFITFIEKELMPYIDEKYATTPHRTLIGHSHAGLFTIATLVNHTDLFNNYIAIDPSMYWDDQRFLKTSLNKLDHVHFENNSLFIALASPLDRSDESIGMDEVMRTNSPHSILARSTLTFCNAVRAKSSEALRAQWKYYPDDIHGTVPLPAMIDGLRFAFEWYQLKNASLYNSPETTIETLKELIDERERVLSKNFGYPTPPGSEELFTIGAQMYLQMEQENKAGFFFEQAAKFYPRSEEAQGNLADFYLESDEPLKAIEYLEKAYELSGNMAYHQQLKKLQGKHK